MQFRKCDTDILLVVCTYIRVDCDNGNNADYGRFIGDSAQILRAINYVWVLSRSCWVKGKGQRATGSRHGAVIHIYSFIGRIFFCIMQRVPRSRRRRLKYRERFLQKRKKQHGNEKRETRGLLAHRAENAEITKHGESRGPIYREWRY